MPDWRILMSRERTPLGLKIPSFLLNFPFSLSTEERNNAWMEDASDEELELDREEAYTQWVDLYNILAAGALVYLLPSEGNYQDQTYVTNLGLVLPHLVDREVVLLSRFRAKGRAGEEQVGEKFFTSMGYEPIQSPYDWEGEGETKFLRDNIYFGGHGIRSDPRVYGWMRENFAMNIIELREPDEYLYHLDTTLFPLSERSRRWLELLKWI
jgi:N-dimethylarginine dimethylaminohydrolase